jgi:hypothetical protein
MSEENGKYWVGNIRGVKGLKGDDATITGATATVSNTTGTPSVIVTTGGTEGARSFHFDFFGLKGEKGEPGNAGKDATLDVNKITPTYTEATTLTNVESGEALSVAFGKIKKAISSLISHLADTTKHITSAERTKWNSYAAEYWQLLTQKTYTANFVAQMHSGQAFEITGIDFANYEEIKMVVDLNVSLPANSTAARNCIVSFGKTDSSSANAGSYVNVETYQQNQNASATTYNSRTMLKLYAQKYGNNLMFAHQYNGTPVSLIETNGKLYLRVFMTGGTTTSTGNATANIELSIYGKEML